MVVRHTECYMKKMRLSFFTFNYLYDFKYCLDGTFLKIEKEKKRTLVIPESCIPSFLDIVIKKVSCEDGVLNLSFENSHGI